MYISQQSSFTVRFFRFPLACRAISATRLSDIFENLATSACHPRTNFTFVPLAVSLVLKDTHIIPKYAWTWIFHCPHWEFCNNLWWNPLEQRASPTISLMEPKFTCIFWFFLCSYYCAFSAFPSLLENFASRKTSPGHSLQGFGNTVIFIIPGLSRQQDISRPHPWHNTSQWWKPHHPVTPRCICKKLKNFWVRLRCLISLVPMPVITLSPSPATTREASLEAGERDSACLLSAFGRSLAGPRPRDPGTTTHHALLTECSSTWKWWDLFALTPLRSLPGTKRIFQERLLLAFSR